MAGAFHHRCGASLGVLLTDHAEDALHVRQRLGADLAEVLECVPCPLGMGLPPGAGAAGQSDHHGQRMRDHVVHLCGDPRPFGGDGSGLALEHQFHQCRPPTPALPHGASQGQGDQGPRLQEHHRQLLAQPRGHQPRRDREHHGFTGQVPRCHHRQARGRGQRVHTHGALEDSYRGEAEHHGVQGRQDDRDQQDRPREPTPPPQSYGHCAGAQVPPSGAVRGDDGQGDEGGNRAQQDRGHVPETGVRTEQVCGGADHGTGGQGVGVRGHRLPPSVSCALRWS